ncbi:MAG TPA: (2Fe-2S)-binding protein [Symbiobacteriaceae bacterium]|nr:(2Fe-2S)-binding protein [Symbiobacteriaceae bacterium]
MNGRVLSHPILGAAPATQRVVFTFDGRPVEAVDGEPIAAALLANGIRTLRHSERGAHPRGIYCGIGHCYECRVVVDGQPGVRACITPVRAGMVVESEVKAP